MERHLSAPGWIRTGSLCGAMAAALAVSAWELRPPGLDPLTARFLDEIHPYRPALVAATLALLALGWAHGRGWSDRPRATLFSAVATDATDERAPDHVRAERRMQWLVTLVVVLALTLPWLQAWTP